MPTKTKLREMERLKATSYLVPINAIDKQRRETEAQVKRIMEARAERGSATQAAHQELEDHQNERNTERETVNGGTRLEFISGKENN